ncbi:MAG: response regulator [Pseudomonadota bacterium]
MTPRGRILLAEDTLANVKLYQTILERAGYHVAVASHGLDAVDKALEERFDLILMDVGLPRIDGVEAATRIRAGDGPMAQAPIIALTADDDLKVRRSCEGAGMNGYLTKPVSPGELLQRIANTIAG